MKKKVNYMKKTFYCQVTCRLVSKGCCHSHFPEAVLQPIILSVAHGRPLSYNSVSLVCCNINRVYSEADPSSLLIPNPKVPATSQPKFVDRLFGTAKKTCLYMTPPQRKSISLISFEYLAWHFSIEFGTCIEK